MNVPALVGCHPGEGVGRIRPPWQPRGDRRGPGGPCPSRLRRHRAELRPLAAILDERGVLELEARAAFSASRPTRTSIQLVLRGRTPTSTAKLRGGSQRSIIAAGVALELVAATEADVAGDGQEPARDALRRRCTRPTGRRASCRVGTGDRDRAGARRLRSRDRRRDGSRASTSRATSLMACSSRRRRCCAGASASPGDFRLERVEARRPERAEAPEPLVDVAQRVGVDGVQPSRAVGSHGVRTRPRGAP